MVSFVEGFEVVVFPGVDVFDGDAGVGEDFDVEVSGVEVVVFVFVAGPDAVVADADGGVESGGDEEGAEFAADVGVASFFSAGFAGEVGVDFGVFWPVDLAAVVWFEGGEDVAARFGDACHFGDDVLGVVDPHEEEVAGGDVEGVGGEGEAVGVSHEEVGVRVVGEDGVGDGEERQGVVDADDGAGGESGEVSGDEAGAAADVQDALCVGDVDGEVEGEAFFGGLLGLEFEFLDEVL